MSDELADNLRRYRRAAGLSQEELAHRSGLSLGRVRKAEQGKDVRMETLHAMARALGVKTSQLMVSGPPRPVRDDGPSNLSLREIRIALTPAVGLVAPSAPAGPEPDLRRLRRMAHDAATLYFADSYASIAADLPSLIRGVADAVAYYDGAGEERRQALVIRSEALQLAGRYLTQIRAYDLAHTALRDAIADARAAGSGLTVGSCVGGMCWMLMRTDRLDEAEEVAATAMDLVEPKITGASADEYATWGGLAMEAAAAAARNNRPDEAKQFRRAAGTAARAVGVAHKNLLRQWSLFGPVTTAMKELEDCMVTGDARAVVRKAEEEEALQPTAWRRLGKPSANDGNRFRLDIARARVRTGDTSAAMDELTALDKTAPEWFRHQTFAAATFEEITRKRRTLTSDMRTVGAHLGVLA